MYPDVAGTCRGEMRTFPFGVHLDHGTGNAEDSTLLLQWSISWYQPPSGPVAGNDNNQRTTWTLRFAFAVLPKSRCLGDGETMRSMLLQFVQRPLVSKEKGLEVWAMMSLRV
jgi:hypothetical protein